MSLPEHLDPASPFYQSPGREFGSSASHDENHRSWNEKFVHEELDAPIGTLEYDLRRGGINWFDSGGTYDPLLQGPEFKFGPNDPDHLTDYATFDGPQSAVARSILALGTCAFAAFAIAALFFAEDIAAIFYR